MTSDLNTLISQIGRELVVCSRSCEGIACDRSRGQIPRCLFLETDDRPGRQGAVIVGLNPGRSSRKEQEYYLERGATYDSVVSWFREHGLRHPYYRHLRKLVDALGLDGPILWTELAKCESAANITGLPPLQTFRTCTGTFLQRELESCPEHWPVFAVGGEAYKGLAYRFPSRTVIGVPHPTGSRGHFHGLFENGLLREPAAGRARAVLSGSGAALWLANTAATTRAL